MIPDRVLRHINENQDRYIEELKEFLRIPSISSPKHAGELRKAAQWVLDRARKGGFSGALYETSHYPIVFAELCPFKNTPTLLLYAHYDVQPPGEMDKWFTPPFSPDIRDGAIYARGAADDKGQLFCGLAAIRSILDIDGELPLNVKLLFEGGEEIGSPGIERFIGEHTEMLKADAVLMTDAPKYARDIPAIYYGLRGGIAYKAEVSGPATTVHSGIYGCAVANPVNALARLLGSIKNDKGKIRIPGFYGRVRGLEEWERKEIASLPFDSEAMKKYLGIGHFAPEEGYTPLECMMARPTFEVNGIAGGDYKNGMLWSIPDKAGAYISFLLVPDQEPEEIAGLFEEYISAHTPEGVTVKLSKIASFDPVLVPRDSKAIRAAEKAIVYGFGKKPALVRSGGGIGVAALMKKTPGLENLVITGWNDPEDNEHGPDELFSQENFRRGMITTAAFMYELSGAIKPEAPRRITRGMT